MKLTSSLFILYVALWLYLALNPWYRDDWLLENLLVFIAVPIVIWSDRRVHFSNTSGLALFIFFVLHAIGAHYSYSEMPLLASFTDFFGFERNHYDRITHFFFGFLLFWPIYELFSSFPKLKYNAFLLSFLLLITMSSIYEVFEWVATELTHPELGSAFLGTQGDQWDAQKDMAYGYFGTLFAALLCYRKIFSPQKAL
jgi:putative membrane protein